MLKNEILNNQYKLKTSPKKGVVFFEYRKTEINGLNIKILQNYYRNIKFL